ncbi:MAG: DUF4893 domain-containing protein [Sphingomicrobium sp.]
MRIHFLFASALLLTGCDAVLQPARLIPEWTTDWRQVATEADRLRLREWRSTFNAAIAAARRSGHGADIDREGVLLKPDAALAGGPIANGDYRCRVIKLGAQSPGMLDYIAYPAFACRVSADRGLQRLDKLSGSQRYAGLIFPNDAVRQLFLGALVLGDESRALQYSQDPSRDVAGYVERIAPRRWRLIMPRPRFESRMDVMELVPAN